LLRIRLILEKTTNLYLTDLLSGNGLNLLTRMERNLPCAELAKGL